MKLNNICVIGMGYVGLTLSVTLAEKGFVVHGIEADDKTFKSLNDGIPHFHEKGIDILLKKHLNSRIFIHKEIPNKKMDVFIICVGTPLDKTTKKPVMKYIMHAATEVKNKLSDGSLVVLRSTVPVGATRSIVKPVLDQSGKKYGLAFCPERTIEGKALVELRQLPQIIGGLDEESIDKSLDLFRKITTTTVEVSSIEAAEMIKLIDNSFRDLNFAYANEIALICENLKLDALEVIKAAGTAYPRTNVPVPGFVGGSCLEKDPYILFEVAKNNGYVPHLIKNARVVNEIIPPHVAQKIANHLKANGKDFKSAKIFISGFAFKGQPDNDDMRGSLTLDLLHDLRNLGFSNIYGHDFLVSKSDLNALNVKVCSIEEGFSNADAVVVATNHTGYYNLNSANLASTMNKSSIIIDVWRVFDKEIFKSKGIYYGGVGIG